MSHVRQPASDGSDPWEALTTPEPATAPTPARVDIGYVTPTAREEFEIWARARSFDLSSYPPHNEECVYPPGFLYLARDGKQHGKQKRRTSSSKPTTFREEKNLQTKIERDSAGVDVEVPPWDRKFLVAQFREAMGPHQKAELAIDLIAARFELLWEARQLNLARIDHLRREVQELKQRISE